MDGVGSELRSNPSSGRDGSRLSRVLSFVALGLFEIPKSAWEFFAAHQQPLPHFFHFPFIFTQAIRENVLQKSHENIDIATCYR
jgi:hypothetical protein